MLVFLLFFGVVLFFVFLPCLPKCRALFCPPLCIPTSGLVLDAQVKRP